MLNFFGALVDFFSPKERDMAQNYLAQSENRYDLENRMNEIEHGRAPFQMRKYPWPL